MAKKKIILLPYSELRDCPKCGASSGVKVGEKMRVRYHEALKEERCHCGAVIGGPMPEHLSITCHVCAYHWRSYVKA